MARRGTLREYDLYDLYDLYVPGHYSHNPIGPICPIRDQRRTCVGVPKLSLRFHAAPSSFSAASSALPQTPPERPESFGATPQSRSVELRTRSLFAALANRLSLQ